MSLAKVFCSWSIAAVLLLLSIALSSSSRPETDDGGEDGDGVPKNKTIWEKTGNPQVDYVNDPNLPRELNGYNLSDYPFYSRVPKNINFSCDGRKDGFYANSEHKCQIYHHCLFSIRSDFLCPNYTGFDQRTFICQFVSIVDCPNSHMFFHRNKDLYVATTAAPIHLADRSIYERRRPPKNKGRLRPDPVEKPEGQQSKVQQGTSAPTASRDEEAAPAPPPPPSKKDYKDADYADEDYYEDDYPAARRPRPRPADRLRRKCRNGRRRGRRCMRRRPVYYEDDYAYDDGYDYAYYDDARPRKSEQKRRRPLNAISAGTSQVTSTSSSETPPPTTTSQATTSQSTTTTIITTTESPPYSSTSSEILTGPYDSESIATLKEQRDELFYKTRRPSHTFRPSDRLRPSRQDKTRSGASSSSPSSSTTTSTTTTERAKPTSTTTTTTTATTEPPQYIYDYEYYEDDTPGMESSSPSPTTTTTTTTVKPYFRGKLSRGGNSAAAALVEKQRVQQSIQVRVTEDQGTNTNTIRRRDNSNVQTPTRVATPPSVVSQSSTHEAQLSSTTGPSASTANRPARFWQRKSTVKSISTTTAPSKTTTTLAPFYQEYQDYDDTVPDPQPSVAPQPPQQSSKFQPLLDPQQHQYGTSPSAALRQYGSTTGPSVPQQMHYATSPRGHPSSSLSSSSYAPPARPNKHYSNNANPMQQYSQSSSSSSSISNSNSNINNNNNNYNTNSYHRQRSPSPPSVVPKPEFISLVDEDYSNPYVTGATSPASASRYNGGGEGGGGGVGYHQQHQHQHPIRFFEQHQPPSFLFGSASEYNAPQFAFPPGRNNFPSPSNFQPYGHSNRRFSAQNLYK